MNSFLFDQQTTLENGTKLWTHMLDLKYVIQYFPQNHYLIFKFQRGQWDKKMNTSITNATYHIFSFLLCDNYSQFHRCYLNLVMHFNFQSSFSQTISTSIYVNIFSYQSLGFSISFPRRWTKQIILGLYIVVLLQPQHTLVCSKFIFFFFLSFFCVWNFSNLRKQSSLLPQ